MTLDHNHPTRNQQIFKLGLSVETVSLYLLCCGLVDAGKKLTLEEIRQVWNADEQALLNSVAELEKRNIIHKIESEGKAETYFRIMDAGGWKPS